MPALVAGNAFSAHHSLHHVRSGQDRRIERAVSAVGRFRSGGSRDVADDHDRYLEEAYADS